MTSIVSGIALSISLVAGGLTVAPAFAQSARSAPGREAPQGMSIAQVQEKLASMGYQNIGRIKRDHNTFEVTASDSNGARVKMHVNAQTGEIVDSRRNERQRDQRSSADESKQGSADCSKRRCRDDQPRQSVATPLTGK